MPSRPPTGAAPLLRFALPDGRPATLLLGEASTVLSVDDALVSSWDLAGRPYALVRETGTYRRGLDGGLLWKREATADGPRLRRRLTAEEGEPILEAARREAEAALVILRGPDQPGPEGSAGIAGPSPPDSNGAPASEHVTPRSSIRAARRGVHRRVGGSLGTGQTGVPQDDNDRSSAQGDPRFARVVTRDDRAVGRLARIVAMDGDALRDDAARFLAASGPVGILPPDQYLALVVRLTEGCSWNACTFCRLYRDVPFRWKHPDELLAHVAALRTYFGPSIALRRSVFLGDANALCLVHDRLLPLVEAVAAQIPGAPLFSFVDAWTGQRRAAAAWRDYAALGLARVYVGLETGDPGLLAWLEKPGSPADAVDLVEALHEAGVAAGVIVLLGAGGERFADAHVARTAEALSAMGLGAEDLVYFSEYVDDPGLAYGRRAAGTPDLQPLPSARCAELRQAILAGLRPADPARPPRSATYDIREFIY